LTVQFTSDVSRPEPVPEAATLWLLASGFIGVTAGAHKRFS
jgi:hypothetical protein